jgi:hypothetical protein
VELDQLPASVRNCKADDLSGLRKLKAVYESPEGIATDAFQNAPHQYTFYRPDQTYAEISGSKSYATAKMMDEVLRDAFQNDVRQYVLGENGAIYLYKDGVVTDSYICNIVTEEEGPFRQSDMLFILTKEASSDIVVKVYSKHAFSANNEPKLLEKKKDNKKSAIKKPAVKKQVKKPVKASVRASKQRRAAVQKKISKIQRSANRSGKSKAKKRR